MVGSMLWIPYVFDLHARYNTCLIEDLAVRNVTTPLPTDSSAFPGNEDPLTRLFRTAPYALTGRHCTVRVKECRGPWAGLGTQRNTRPLPAPE